MSVVAGRGSIFLGNKMKIKVNKNSLTLLAKEFRRASWGAAAAFSVLAASWSNMTSMGAASVVWFSLQIVAFVLESVELDE